MTKALFAAILSLLLVAVLIQSAPPTPHSVAGYIFTNGTNQVPLGTVFTLYDINSTDYVKSVTNIPVPGLTGRYFESINGSDNDTVLLTAWNNTHWGRTNFTLLGSMDNVNVLLNMTRQTETNVSITAPGNDTNIAFGSIFNITALVSVIGPDGVNCNASLSITNDTVFNVTGGDKLIHQLGNIQSGEAVETYWNLSGDATGSANATVEGICAEAGSNLEESNTDTVYNITVLVDSEAPVISLITPENATTIDYDFITFNYNVTDLSFLANCSLVINNEINVTNSTPVTKGTTQNFTQTLDNGNYTWSVSCTDIEENTGQAAYYNLTVVAGAPIIYSVLATSPIILAPGGTTQVWCNATVAPSSASVNITEVNATLFDSSRFIYSVDDNNDHYTNSSCTNSSLTNFNCAFNLWYYANNASWQCAIGAKDSLNRTSILTNTTVVNELLSLNTTDVIDYGEAGATEVSEVRNITIFNIGNKAINLTVRGFGGSENDGFAMGCDQSTGINVSEHRFSINHTGFENMTNLSTSNQKVANFTLLQRTDDFSHTNDQNQTFWRIRLPTAVGRFCNGTIVVTAQQG